MLGQSPLWASARSASTASVMAAKPTEADARYAGRGCTRSQASQMMPSEPSDPSTSRSGDGPAPLPGRRRLSHGPAGVSIVIDSTKSSMWVGPVAKWPPARVATHPPTVENSKLWGKCRKVRP